MKFVVNLMRDRDSSGVNSPLMLSVDRCADVSVELGHSCR